MVPSFLVLVIGLWLLAGSAAAEPLYEAKVYNPETKSYFELVRNQQPGLSIRCRTCYELSWAAARRVAHQRTFKGVRGRLAVVKSRQVNDFLGKTFRPERAVWIGLRYLCRFNKFQWITGEFHPHTGYANWDMIWNQAGTRNGDLGRLGRKQCRKGVSEYWPVHYWGINHGFRWNANGTIKEFFQFFVEYPTGKKVACGKTEGRSRCMPSEPRIDAGAGAGPAFTTSFLPGHFNVCRRGLGLAPCNVIFATEPAIRVQGKTVKCYELQISARRLLPSADRLPSSEACVSIPRGNAEWPPQMTTRSAT